MGGVQFHIPSLAKQEKSPRVKDVLPRPTGINFGVWYFEIGKMAGGNAAMLLHYVCGVPLDFTVSL